MIWRVRAQAPASPALVGTRTGAMPAAISRTSWFAAGSYSHTDPRSARRTCLAALTTSDSIVLRSNGAASLLVTARIASMSGTERWRLFVRALMQADHNLRERVVGILKATELPIPFNGCGEAVHGVQSTPHA